MINAAALTDRISNNCRYIEKILVALGYREDELRYNIRGYYQFRRPDGDNNTAIQLWVNNLNYVCYTRPEKGNLYTLVMKIKQINFPQALRWVADQLNFWPNGKADIIYPFGGFYRGLSKTPEFPEYALKTYDESIIMPYQNALSYMWNQDGISYRTQEIFGVGMDLQANAILIPERSITGELIGIQARQNSSHCPHTERWWAYVPCQRNYTLFGYSFNYQAIIEKQIVWIVESEKSVMKGYEMGIRNVVAICGSVLSEVQVRLLKGLQVKTYILALDDGLPPEHYEHEAEKLLVHTNVWTSRVFYIRDDKHKYLVNGEKESPFDKSLNTLKRMAKECLKEVRL